MTTAQLELISILVEELGEATQAAGKILRFGLDNINPDTGEKNINRLEAEIGDVFVAIALLSTANLIDMDVIYSKHVPAKEAKLQKWLVNK